MLRSFDFFRKIRTEQQLTSATGGFFTIISLIVRCGLVRRRDCSSCYRCRTSTR
jgi:hypothetical protein